MIPIATTFGISRGLSTWSTSAIVSARSTRRTWGGALASLPRPATSAPAGPLLSRAEEAEGASRLLGARSFIIDEAGVRGGVIAGELTPLRLGDTPRGAPELRPTVEGAAAVWKGSSLSITS